MEFHDSHAEEENYSHYAQEEHKYFALQIARKCE